MRGIQEKVLNHIQGRPGFTLTATGIADDLGFSRRQVMNATYELNRAGLITKVKTGMFRFDGSAFTTGPVFEQIAETKDGKLVLEAEDGKLFVAEAI